MKNMKVAIVHDWLNGMRGGEKVLEEILRIFPEADIFTLFYKPEAVSELIRERNVFASSLSKYSFINKNYRYFLPFMPSLVEDFNLSGYDLVISSSHCVAKGAVSGPQALHVSYIHSPMRYVWDQYYAYFGHTSGLKRAIIRNSFQKLRTWDAASSLRVDDYIANSEFVRKRIRKYYRRDAEVIHPPIDTAFFFTSEGCVKEDYYVTVSALVPYKRNDILVDAFNKSGRRLVIIGKGPEGKSLKKKAQSNIQFMSDLGSEEFLKTLASARGFVYAGTEDFGMAFAESLACGVPVIAHNSGGVRDIVVNSDTGLLYREQTADSLNAALNEFEKKEFNDKVVRAESLKFSREEFQRKFREFIEKRV